MYVQKESMRFAVLDIDATYTVQNYQSLGGPNCQTDKKTVSSTTGKFLTDMTSILLSSEPLILLTVIYFETN